MKRLASLKFLIGALCLAVIVTPAMLFLVPVRKHSAQAAPEIYASAVHAGCYLARHDLCKIHVEPFTITVADGQKLVMFRLMASPSGGSTVPIYDFRPDLSIPLPYSGTTVTPSLVNKDFAATCGKTYSVSLQGQDTGDRDVYNLGTSGQFTCPTGSYPVYLPEIQK